MPRLRIKCNIIIPGLPIVRVEVASHEITEYKTTLRLILELITVSTQYNGCTFPTETELIPATDEDYPVATGCYLKFDTLVNAVRFLKSINLE